MSLIMRNGGPLLSGQSILVVGTDCWFSPMVSKQHIVLELCKRNRVLYVEPFYYVDSLLKGHLPGSQRDASYHDKKPPELSLITPWRLPKSGTSTVVRRLSESMVLAQLRARRFKPDVIISFNPYFSFLADRWKVPFIYYCVDIHLDEASEAETLSRASLVVAATKVLYRRFQGRTQRLEYLPHGVSLDVLYESADHTPPEMADLPRPIVGFVGSIGEHLDISLLEKLSRSIKEGSIVLVGPYARNSFGGGLSDEALTRLRALPNLHLLGPRPSDQLGAYFNSLDVGLVAKDTSHPLVHFSYSKVMQYLALGKPVVTTCFATSDTLPPHVTVAENHEDFIAAVRQVLREQDSDTAEECRAFARGHTWERRVAQMADWIKEGARPNGDSAR